MSRKVITNEELLRKDIKAKDTFLLDGKEIVAVATEGPIHKGDILCYDCMLRDYYCVEVHCISSKDRKGIHFIAKEANNV